DEPEGLDVVVRERPALEDHAGVLGGEPLEVCRELGRPHGHACAGLAQQPGAALGDGAAADDEARPVLERREKRQMMHWHVASRAASFRGSRASFAAGPATRPAERDDVGGHDKPRCRAGQDERLRSLFQSDRVMRLGRLIPKWLDASAGPVDTRCNRWLYIRNLDYRRTRSRDARLFSPSDPY